MADLLRANRLSGGWYAEPYAGGAGIALHLLIEGYVREIFINDLDPAIYSFWRSMVDHSDELIYRVETTPISVAERDRQTAILRAPNSHDTIDVGFAALFVNRTSRSGILSGGAIGGREQLGKWKIDARFNRTNLISRIRRVALHRNRIHASGQDAMDFLQTLPDRPDYAGLVYLDPPYFSQGGDLYCNSYTAHDHAAVASWVQQLNRPWIVTYDVTPDIERLYDWSVGGQFELYYTANHKSRRHEKELIYYGGLQLHPEPYSKR